LSTHYPVACRPSDRDERLLDLCARQAADFIERIRVQRLLDEYRHSLEKKVEQRTRELAESRDKLRMSDRMASIGTLAAGLGHDMNNVLLPVRARVNALTASGKAGMLHGPDLRHVREIQKSVGYLQQLTDGLHFLALDPETEEDVRGGGGATDLKRWWSQAGALLSKAVPKHVRVTASLPADLPPLAVAPHGLTQAVLNLVVNAGEAIPTPKERKRKQGWVRLWAEPKRDARGQWVCLAVSDNGTGMSEEVKHRAFEMFFTTKPRGLGTGLGLALVRRIMERAGGAVEIRSELGKGSTVVMIVPAVRGADPEARAAAASAVISIGDGRAAGLIRRLLESSGARVLGGDPEAARIWILDPLTTDVRAAAGWRRLKPEGRLVLFGRPDAASADSWTPLNPITIEAPDDLSAVRTALGVALMGGGPVRGEAH
jgi:signal transduction histidine kinase